MKQALGAWGEERARRYALVRGATLVARNVRERGGEIDLILRHWTPPHWGLLVFAEVKTRSEGFDAAFQAITGRKQRRVRTAARRWLQRQGLCPLATPHRFDVFAVTRDESGRALVRWAQDAFLDG